MKKSLISIVLVVIILATCMLIPVNEVKATEEVFINKAQTATATLDEEGTLTINGTGVVGEGLDKTRYVSSYQKDIGENNISEDNEIIISEFWNGKNLYFEGKDVKKVIIGEGITGIENDIFNQCDNLRSIEIPSTVSYIGDKAFHYTYGLEEIKINENNTHFSSDSGVLFNKNKTQLINYPKGKTDTQYVIPDTVTNIKGLSFTNNGLVKTIQISKNVEQVESNAFRSCHSLENIIVAEENPNYLTIDGILYNKDKTDLICYPSEKQGKTYTINENVKTIKEYAFSNNYHLEDVDVSTVEAIERGAFYGIQTLKKVKLPEAITQMGTAVFSGDISLKEVTLPKGITKLEACTFTDANGLLKVNLPSTITEIGDYAFTGCSYLQELAIPVGTKKIGKQILQSCYKIEKLYIPSTVEEIGSLGEKLSNTDIYCKGGTFAQEYLEKNQYECKIDNVAPVMIITYSELEKTKQPVDVIIRTLESVAPIEGWESTLEGKKMTKNYTQNTEEKISLTDLVGNVAQAEIKIENIDTEVPNILVTYEKVEGTNVKVTLVSNEELQQLEGWTLSEDKKELVKQYEKQTEDEVVVKDLAGNETTVQISITDFTAQVTYSSIEPTKENVNITITSDRELKELEGWILSENKMSLTKEATENVKRAVNISDKDGNLTTVKVEVNNIDKNPPEIEVNYSTTELTKEEIKVTLTSNEAMQELEGWTLSKDKLTLEKAYKENVQQEIEVKDLLGNAKKVNIVIENYDTTPENIEVSYNTKEPTKENVTATITSKVALQELEGWVLSEDKLTLTKTYEDNVKETVTIHEEGNKEIAVRIEISNIDRITPEIQVEYNNQEITSQDVVATIKSNEPLQTLEGWKLSEDKLSLTKSYDENKTEQVTIIDLAGNEKQVTIAVQNIDKVAPTIQIDYKKQLNNPENEAEGYETIVTITADEVIREIEGWTLSENGRSLTKSYKENIKEEIEVSDIIGNKVIANIDIGELKLEVKYHNLGTSSIDVVTVSIVANRELKTIEGWELSADKKMLTKSFAENVNKYITVEDITGNVSYIEVLITDIGKSLIKGDINQDGKIDTADLLSILRHIAVTKSEDTDKEHVDWVLEGNKFELADVTGDNKIDTADALKLQRHIAAEKSESVKEKHPDWIIKFN